MFQKAAPLELGPGMNLRYFSDTDTLLIELRHTPVVETIAAHEDVHMDIDENGRVASITLEHALCPTP